MDWKRTEVPRTAFDADILGSLGAFMTVYRIRAENAEERIRAIMEGRSPETPTFTPEELEVPLSMIDIEEQANDQIRTYIDRRFRGHDFADLVAAILEAKGYKIDVSAPGPDSGVDIVAGRGVMGFDSPRLIVQVKSGGITADVKVARELKGVMDDFEAEHALIVSWGGFARSVMKESRKQFFKVRLWDSEDVLHEIKTNYDNLPEDIQANIPLKRAWVLVEGSESQ